MELSAVVISLAVFTFVGFVPLLKKYFFKDYKSDISLNWFQIAAGLCMTFSGGAATLAMSSLGYQYGWWALVDPLAVCLGFLVVVLFFIKQYNSSHLTIAQTLAGSDRKLLFLTSTVTLIVYLLLSASQIVAFAKLLQPILGLTPTTIMLGFTCLVASYIFSGGFEAVTKTDTIQFFFICIYYVIPVYLSGLFHPNNISLEAVEFAPMSWNLLILLSLAFLFIPVSQDVLIRLKKARNTKQALIGCLCAGLFYFLITGASVYLGHLLAASGVQLLDTEQALTEYFNMNFRSYSFIAVIAVTAAILSTYDSYVFNSSVIIENDFLQSSHFSKKTFLATLTASLIPLCIAVFYQQVLRLILTALLIYISVLIPIAFAKRMKIKDNFLFAISSFYILTMISIEVIGTPLPLKALVYPLGHLLIIIFVHFISQRSIKSHS